MHTVLGDTNKAGLNHLIQYEHSKYQEILQDLNLASSQEQLRQFEIDSYLPTNMPLIRETRERISKKSIFAGVKSKKLKRGES